MMRNAWFAVVSGFGLGLFFSTVTACGGTPVKCSSSNCDGCCTSEGTCSGGGTVLECGINGALCKVCGASDQCIAGTCQTSSMGGGTGGGATGGGTGGGAMGGGTGGGSTGGGTGGGAVGGGTGGGTTGGGAGGGTGGGATGGGTGGGATGGGGGSVAACGARAVVDHLVISEVRVTPTPGEAIEIYNPTSATVTLTNYWLYNATFNPTDGGVGCHYYDHVSDPSCGLGFGDFDMRFPPGATIGPGEAKVIALTGAANFTSQCDGGCVSTQPPDFEIPPPTGGDPTVPDMIGSWDSNAQNFTSFGFLTNSSEDLILYQWDGASGAIMDVDYFIWGSNVTVRTDKTGISGFVADTPVASQLPITTSASVGNSYQRACYNETTETATSGNGVTGHDETSEDLGSNFVVAPPSFGVKTPGTLP